MDCPTANTSSKLPLTTVLMASLAEAEVRALSLPGPPHLKVAVAAAVVLAVVLAAQAAQAAVLLVAVVVQVAALALVLVIKPPEAVVLMIPTTMLPAKTPPKLR
jgi:hypothetical protein